MDPHPLVQAGLHPHPSALSQETGACSQITGGCKVSFPERLQEVLGAPDCFWARVPPPASGPLCGGISTHPGQRRSREPSRCGCGHEAVGMAWGAALTPSSRLWQALRVSPHPRGCPSQAGSTGRGKTCPQSLSSMRFAIEPLVAAEGDRNPSSGPLPSIPDSGLPRECSLGRWCWAVGRRLTPCCILSVMFFCILSVIFFFCMISLMYLAYLLLV